ncbi:MAG TPA: Rrf2 family transcriptional regulator [bacterium]|nr:Rrf2 family transcriptional regulator [bacterium]
MKISTRGRYGLRVMMELATRNGRGPIFARTIAKNQGISDKYIHTLMTGLVSAGLVRTVRGPGGGYEMTKDPSEITALDVVRVLEGNSAPAECVSDATCCPRAERCAARDVWCEVASAMDGVLSSLTLEQLVDRQRRKQEEPVTYDI